VTAIEHSEFGEGWLLFNNPCRKLLAWTLAEVVPLLNEIDQLTDDGCYSAGFAFYDASPAFDPSFKTKRSEVEPFINKKCGSNLVNKQRKAGREGLLVVFW